MAHQLLLSPSAVFFVTTVLPIALVGFGIVYLLKWAKLPQSEDAWRWRQVRRLLMALIIAWVLAQVALQIVSHRA